MPHGIGERTLCVGRGCAPNAHRCINLVPPRCCCLGASSMHTPQQSKHSAQELWNSLDVEGRGINLERPFAPLALKLLDGIACVCCVAVHFSLFKSVVEPRGILCLLYGDVLEGCLN
jgi:hypothetical protein